MADSIASRVAAVIAKTQHIEVAAVTPEKTLAELGLDSLDGMKLMFELEEEFGIEIPDEQAKGYTSVSRVTEGVTFLVERKASASSQA